MPIATPLVDDSHQRLLDCLDLYKKPRRFRNLKWKPSQRRNKNVKQIISEASRKEASMQVTQSNSGSSTPKAPLVMIGNDTLTPRSENCFAAQPVIAKATQRLSTMVLERNLQTAMVSGPSVTFTNIESAPSLHPGHGRPYCDITGLHAPYRDPETRLRYHNREVFDLIRSLPQGIAEKYLEARGAHVILK